MVLTTISFTPDRWKVKVSLLLTNSASVDDESHACTKRWEEKRGWMIDREENAATFSLISIVTHCDTGVYRASLGVSRLSFCCCRERQWPCAKSGREREKNRWYTWCQCSLSEESRKEVRKKDALPLLASAGNGYCWWIEKREELANH